MQKQCKMFKSSIKYANISIIDSHKKEKFKMMNNANKHQPEQIFDLLVIGGGVNGCSVARDAVGRGLSVVLVEKNDLAAETSSASTKLLHGGLRYLEHLKIRLVRESLIEREILLRAMPHISWPMRFVLPYSPTMRFVDTTLVSKILNTCMPWLNGHRPAWIIRFGLWLYDHLGGRKILPPTRTLDLRVDPVGAPLKDVFVKGYEYSDCWVEDSRLVVLNARDAAERGAHILTRTTVTKLSADQSIWCAQVQHSATNTTSTIKARCIINAAGPWVQTIMQISKCTAMAQPTATLRLVKGSHIVTRALFAHDKAYFLQGNDGRIIFAIPYENQFTLIGTTDTEHKNPNEKPQCTDQEINYLLHFASQYFQQPITKSDIVWTYAGVRPLYDSGETINSNVTRDYVLRFTHSEQCPPMLSIFGGKITTHRKLAEQVLHKIRHLFPNMTKHWTAGVPLPGGDFAIERTTVLMNDLQTTYPFIDAHWAKRLVRAYGTDARTWLGNAKTINDLGQNFGATLTEREVEWLQNQEFAQTANDVLWRRSKLGLHMNAQEQNALKQWFEQQHIQA